MAAAIGFLHGAVADRRRPAARRWLRRVLGALAAALAQPVWAQAELAGARAAAAAESALTAPVPYTLERLALEYAEPHPEHPPIAELEQLRVELVRSALALRGAEPGEAGLALALGELGSLGLALEPSALRAIAQRVVRELGRRGLDGVLVQPHPAQIDPESQRDLRPAGERELRLQIWTGRVKGLRVVAREEPPSAAQIGSSAHARLYERIASHSPLRGETHGAGDLLRVRRLNDYLFRLNRHPGRRVDAVVSPALEPGGVYLSYRVAQEKPWTLYAGTADSGSRRTGRDRRRIGFQHTQLSGRDDIAQLEYVTSDFKGIHAWRGVYEAPWSGSERLRLRWSGAAASFAIESDMLEPDDVLSMYKLTGDDWQLGASLIYTLWQSGRTFVDVELGGRTRRIRTDNPAVWVSGSGAFWLPSVGLQLERQGENAALFASLQLEGNLPGRFGSADEIDPGLGTLRADPAWRVLRWQGRFSAYLDPLWRGADAAYARAHELVLRTHGQHAFGSVLIPQEQAAAGGADSVRGYANSASGDSAYVVSAEYRMHLTRLLPPREALRLPRLGAVRATPGTRGEPADWDLVAYLFADAAWVRHSRTTHAVDEARSLLGLGAGLELGLRRNLRARLELGWPFTPDRAPGQMPGQARRRRRPEAHFSVTTLY
jgi:hemolysin activation/secretion protein